MIKLYYDNITVKEYLLLLIPILVAPIVMGPTGIYLDTIMYSHYITLVPNVIFIIFCYKQYTKINTMYTIITTRIGNFKIFLVSTLFGISITIIYSIILYLYLAMILELPNTMNIKVTCIYIGSSILFYFIEQFVMVFQLGSRKNILFVILPIILNFIFHYYIVPTYYI